MNGKNSQTGTKEKLNYTEKPRSLRKFLIGMTAVGLLAVTYVARLYWISPEQADAQQKPSQFRTSQSVTPTQSSATTQRPEASSATSTKPTPKPVSSTNKVSQAVANTPVKNSASDAKKLKVVAQVNGENISRNDLAQACLDRFGKETLEGYLNKRLIKQACEKHQIDIRVGRHFATAITSMRHQRNPGLDSLAILAKRSQRSLEDFQHERIKELGDLRTDLDPLSSSPMLI